VSSPPNDAQNHRTLQAPHYLSPQECFPALDSDELKQSYKKIKTGKGDCIGSK